MPDNLCQREREERLRLEWTEDETLLPNPSTENDHVLAAAVLSTLARAALLQ